MKGAVRNNRIGAGRSVRIGLSVGLSGVLLMVYVLSASYYYSRAYEHQMEHLESIYPPGGHENRAEHRSDRHGEPDREHPCTKCILLELASRACRQLSNLGMTVSLMLMAYLSIYLIENQSLYIPYDTTLVSLKIRLDC